MKKEPNKKLIGIFIVLGIAAFTLIFGHVLVNKFLPDNKNVVVMYFDESIKGLSVGSSVVFKGVEIGKVTKIEIDADPKSLSFQIPVYAQIAPAENVFLNSKIMERNKFITAFIEKGLRARLVSQNILTGQLMIELELLPDVPATFHHADQDGVEIPTALSQIGELSRGFRPMLEQFNATLTELKNVLEPTAELARNLTNHSNVTLATFNQTVQNVGDAAKSIQILTDYLEQHPETLLKGKKGK